jgi:calcineurin-like phosphoesterase family protein
MLKIDTDRKVWITSDTHYNHSNICRGVTNWRDDNDHVPQEQTRDFDTLEKMNDTIVNNINTYVDQDDVLIHLGDWSFGGFEQIKIFRDRIVCREVHLILGNHDHHIDRNKGECQKNFSSVQWFLQLGYGDDVLELMHYPISSWNKLRKGRIHLHGHCHLPYDKKISNGRRMDIGMDGHPEFRPYELVREILNPLKKLPIGFELGSLDHHGDNIKNKIDR